LEKRYQRGSKTLKPMKQLMGAIKRMLEREDRSMDGALRILDLAFQDKKDGAKLCLATQSTFSNEKELWHRRVSVVIHNTVYYNFLFHLTLLFYSTLVKFKLGKAPLSG
jgi:hypothetical protein